MITSSSRATKSSIAQAAADDITFEITYPKTITMAADAAHIGELLATAVNRLSFAPDQGLGMPFKGMRKTTIPVDITYLSDWLFRANTVRYGDSDGESIRLSAYKLGGDQDPWPSFKSVPRHELVHMSQHYYGGAERDAGWLWMDDATATWFEDFATDDPNRIPATVLGGAKGELRSDSYISFIRSGLIYQPQFSKGGTNENPAFQHGYGASMFLTWLGRRFAPGPALIGDFARALELMEFPNTAITTCAQSARRGTAGSVAVLRARLPGRSHLPEYGHADTRSAESAGILPSDFLRVGAGVE